MRKSHWVSVCLAFAIAAAIAFLEQRRGVYFLSPRLESTASSAANRLVGYRLGRLMQRAEWSTSDIRFKLRGQRKFNSNVVIIAIDEDSLAKLHQWPWPRSVHARLIEKLKASPPRALLFDIFFIEPFSTDPAGDRALVEATRGKSWVAHSRFLTVDDGVVKDGGRPFEKLADAAEQVGSVNAFIDEDGVLRSTRLSMPLGDAEIPLLSLIGASLYTGKSMGDVVHEATLDPRGELLVNFAGEARTFEYVSYVKVLNGEVPASHFKDKAVLVGSNATGTFDHYPTPLHYDMPGVELHANVIENLIDHCALHYAGLRVTYALIAFFALLVGFIFVRFSAGTGAIAALVALLAYGAVAQWLFTARHILIDLAGPIGTLGLSYLAIVIYRFFTEEREKRWVKAAFGQYVSPKVLDILMEDPTKLKMVGERREMTVFFSDVAGFTSISERLNPDELVVLLNRYLSAMTEVVFKYDGYLNKYMGDGIMAFWNAPVKQADHAERACRCALDSRRRLVSLNEELAAQGMMPLKARIGLNSGVMIVGNMGSIQKSDYTVMGDNVNLGSRLEGANKPYGTEIMISEFTYELVQHQFEVRYLDRIRVPGKAKPVKTYELLGEKGSLTGPWTAALPPYHEAIQLYIDRKFDESRIKFLEVLKILGHDKPCETYLERIELFSREAPAKEWDGVFEVKTK